MIKIKLLLAVFLISGGPYLQQAAAQEKSKAELEKEIEIQLTIEQHKKAMAEQKKAQIEAGQVLKELTHKELEVEYDSILKDKWVKDRNAGRYGESFRIYNQRGNRSLNKNEGFDFSSPNVESYYGHTMGDSERTTWDFSRYVKEKTFSRNYTFDVDKSANTVIMSVMGDCKAGDIRIRIVMPNGKSYSDIVIDEFGNLNWRKSFTISGTENQDKTGEWKFEITSTKATGFFKISLQMF